MRLPECNRVELLGLTKRDSTFFACGFQIIAWEIPPIPQNQMGTLCWEANGKYL